MNDTPFEALLIQHQRSVERFVRFRLPTLEDAQDVLSQVYLAAFEKYNALADKAAFKAWLLSIARNKCHDFYRARARLLELPLDEEAHAQLSIGRLGLMQGQSAVSDTLDALQDKDKQILLLFFFKNKPQADIAAELGIPIGTVKSRLHAAKARFRRQYPHSPVTKGADTMKTLPAVLPEYRITLSDKPPFAITWQELMGWFIIPRLGESCTFALYDMPERKRTEHTQLTVTGRAEVHGIEGVEILALQHAPMPFNATGDGQTVERRFVAQLTDTHCRLLAQSHTQGGIKRFYTFLDGDAFLDNWGLGEDNCGNYTYLAPKGEIIRQGDTIHCPQKPWLVDIVGRYQLDIGSKTYDTVCVMDIGAYEQGVATQQFIDQSGRTILWQRFNRDDWAAHRYKEPWTKKLPHNARITVNGATYVHWYDCITDYIL